MKLGKIIEIPNSGDGTYSHFELTAQEVVPFDIKRIYYIFDTKHGVSRGFHAHRNLKQFAVCVAGKCRMRLDDGRQFEDVWLDSPNKGLLIEGLLWREMHEFSEGCVLLVMASEYFDESDYIREYGKFSEVVNGRSV